MTDRDRDEIELGKRAADRLYIENRLSPEARRSAISWRALSLVYGELMSAEAAR